MNPATFLSTLNGILAVVLGGIGTTAFLIGTIAWIAGKSLNNPGWVSWGKNGWIGGVVGYGSAGVLAIITFLGEKFGGKAVVGALTILVDLFK